MAAMGGKTATSRNSASDAGSRLKLLLDRIIYSDYYKAMIYKLHVSCPLRVNRLMRAGGCFY